MNVPIKHMFVFVTGYARILLEALPRRFFVYDIFCILGFFCRLLFCLGFVSFYISDCSVFTYQICSAFVLSFMFRIFSTDFWFWFLLYAIALVCTLNNLRIQQVIFQLFTWLFSQGKNWWEHTRSKEREVIHATTVRIKVKQQ